MKRRFKRYITYLFNRYIPGTSKLAVMEATRLSKYFFDTIYDENQQLVLLEELKINLISMREQQIKDKEEEIIISNKDLSYLKVNLEKLITK